MTSPDAVHFLNNLVGENADGRGHPFRFLQNTWAARLEMAVFDDDRTNERLMPKLLYMVLGALYALPYSSACSELGVRTVMYRLQPPESLEVILQFENSTTGRRSSKAFVVGVRSKGEKNEDDKKDEEFGEAFFDSCSLRLVLEKNVTHFDEFYTLQLTKPDTGLQYDIHTATGLKKLTSRPFSPMMVDSGVVKIRSPTTVCPSPDGNDKFRVISHDFRCFDGKSRANLKTISGPVDQQRYEAVKTFIAHFFANYPHYQMVDSRQFLPSFFRGAVELALKKEFSIDFERSSYENLFHLVFWSLEENKRKRAVYVACDIIGSESDETYYSFSVLQSAYHFVSPEGYLVTFDYSSFNKKSVVASEVFTVNTCEVDVEKPRLFEDMLQTSLEKNLIPHFQQHRDLLITIGLKTRSMIHIKQSGTTESSLSAFLIGYLMSLEKVDNNELDKFVYDKKNKKEQPFITTLLAYAKHSRVAVRVNVIENLDSDDDQQYLLDLYNHCNLSLKAPDGTIEHILQVDLSSSTSACEGGLEIYCQVRVSLLANFQRPESDFFTLSDSNRIGIYKSHNPRLALKYAEEGSLFGYEEQLPVALPKFITRVCTAYASLMVGIMYSIVDATFPFPELPCVISFAHAENNETVMLNVNINTENPEVESSKDIADAALKSLHNLMVRFFGDTTVASKVVLASWIVHVTDAAKYSLVSKVSSSGLLDRVLDWCSRSSAPSKLDLGGHKSKRAINNRAIPTNGRRSIWSSCFHFIRKLTLRHSSARSSAPSMIKMQDLRSGRSNHPRNLRSIESLASSSLTVFDFADYRGGNPLITHRLIRGGQTSRLSSISYVTTTDAADLRFIARSRRAAQQISIDKHIKFVNKLVKGLVVASLSANIVSAAMDRDWLGFGFHSTAVSLILAPVGYKMLANKHVIGAGRRRLLDILLGKGSRMALSLGVIVSTTYDLIHQYNAHRSGDPGALINVYIDASILFLSTASLFIDIGVSYGVLSFTGAAVISTIAFTGALLLLTCQFVASLQKIGSMSIELTGMEKWLFSFKASVGKLDESDYINRLNAKYEMNQEALKTAEEMFVIHEGLEYVFFSIAYNKTLQPFLLDLSKSKTKTVLTRTWPIVPSGIEVVAMDGEENDMSDKQTSYDKLYPTENAIGFRKIRVGNDSIKDPATVYILSTDRPGTKPDEVRGFENKINLFWLGDGPKNVTGGNQDDVFFLTGNYTHGNLDGQLGDNLLDLSRYNLNNDNELEIDLLGGKLINKYKHLYVRNINKILGRANKPDHVNATCDTNLVDLQGSGIVNAELLSFHEEHCFYNVTVMIAPNIIIASSAQSGLFTYKLSKLDQGMIFINYERGSANVTTLVECDVSLWDIEQITLKDEEIKIEFKLTVGALYLSVKGGRPNLMITFPTESTQLTKELDTVYVTLNTNQSAETVLQTYPHLADKLGAVMTITCIETNAIVMIGHNKTSNGGSQLSDYTNANTLYSNYNQTSYLIGRTGVMNMFIVMPPNTSTMLWGEIMMEPVYVFNGCDASSQKNELNLYRVEDWLNQTANAYLQVSIKSSDEDVQIKLEAYISQNNISVVGMITLKNIARNVIIEDGLDLLMHSDKLVTDRKIVYCPKAVLIGEETDHFVLTDYGVREYGTIRIEQPGNSTRKFYKQRGTNDIIMLTYVASRALPRLFLRFGNYRESNVFPTLLIEFDDGQFYMKDVAGEIGRAEDYDSINVANEGELDDD